MKKLVKSIAAVGAAIIAAGTLAACGGGKSSANGITITVWEDGENIEMLEKLAEQFISDYSRDYSKGVKITINFEEQSERSAVEQMGLHGSSGNGADIFAFVNDTLGTAVETGVIAPNMFAETYENTHTKEAVIASSINNTVYGYPITSESMTIMYDKSKLSETQVQTLAGISQSGQKIAWQLVDDAYYGSGILSDAVIYGADGTDKSVMTVGTQSATNFNNVVTKYASAIVANQKPENAVSLLQSGDIAGIITTPFLLDAVQNQLGDNFAIAKLPSIDGVEQTPFAGYKMYGVSSYSQNPYVAHAFAKYLTGQDAQTYRFTTKQLIPTQTQALEDAEGLINKYQSKYATAKVFKDSLALSRSMPSILEMGNYWAPMQDAFAEIWNRGTNSTAETALATLRSGFEKVLSNQN